MGIIEWFLGHPLGETRDERINRRIRGIAPEVLRERAARIEAGRLATERAQGGNARNFAGAEHSFEHRRPRW